jgi:sugar phosphate isomerase/epimerase
MHLTRREWHALVVGGLVAAPLSRRPGAQKPTSTIAGVRIGAQTYSFRDRSLDELIAAMTTIGLSYCELWQDHIETREAIGAVPEGASRRDALRKWRLTVPLDVFTEVRQKFDRAGITLTAYNLSFRDDFTDDEIARGFDMARALGVDVITASSNVTTARRLDPFAKKANIKIGLHNHSDIKPNEFATAADFAAALDGVSNMIAINLDIGHFVAAGGDPLEFLDRNHARIVSIHVKDRTKAGGNLPFGAGGTPIVAVLQRLRDRKWDIPACIEYEYRGTDTVEEVRKSFEYCKRALDTRTP